MGPSLSSNSAEKNEGAAFTLVELLTVLAVLGLLAAILLPAIGRARAAAQSAVCAGNLRQMQLALNLYLADHEDRFFPFREPAEGGKTLWYFGLGGDGAEGARDLDKSKGRLAPYLGQAGGVEICPALLRSAPYFKRKFSGASYGYGLNHYLLADSPVCKKSGIRRFHQIASPARVITWADSIQINTWQAPASPSNPMLEEWYYLDSIQTNSMPSPKFHFRHNGKCQAVFGDGHVQALAPWRLDPRCDGQVGYLEPPGQDRYLRTAW